MKSKKNKFGTGEVFKPKGVIKDGVWTPPESILNNLVKDKVELSKDAKKVLGKRWSRKDDKGLPKETPEESFARVAWWIAQVDGVFGGNIEESTKEFYHLLQGLLHIPDSPVFTGSGTPLGQLAGCFVLPISDDMGKEEEGIFSTLKDAALVQQTGGGNGFSFSRLREKDTIVKSSMGKASGPLGFLSVYNSAFGVIAQGGTRRGANMGVLRVDHPDILEFIRSKKEEGKISNFNISVALTDKFMRAVDEDSEFELVSPKDGKVKNKVVARELFDEIIKYAHHNGEPGALFIDAANKTNPVSHLYNLEATNPCGEQWLGPYESCCLGAVNLARHTNRGKIDWEKLAKTVRTVTHFHDNIVSANKYVPAVPELKEAAYKCRRIGIGIMGLADVMYQLGVRYGSREGEELAAQIMEFVKYYTMVESISLARERGPFPAIKGSIYDKKNFSWQPPKPLFPYTKDFGRPELNWGEVVSDIKKYGIRNAAQQVIGPCGTKGTVAEVEGYGCEPVFALAYIRHVIQEGEDFTIHYRSPLFEKALKESGLTKNEIDETFAAIEADPTGGCQNISNVPEALKQIYSVSSDITADEHVRIQAALQPFVDNSISKTCNFPATATEKDVAKVYLDAWRLGCKGLTVYVTGSRQNVVLETNAEASSKKDGASGMVDKEPLMVRPFRMTGATYKLQTPVGTAFVTINQEESGDPLEIFINVGKAGSDVAAMAEALGRTISAALRFRGSLGAKEKAREIALQLSGIGGRRSVGFGLNKIRSLPDAIAFAFSSHYGFKLNGDSHEAYSNGEAGAVMVAHSPAQGQPPNGGLSIDPVAAPAENANGNGSFKVNGNVQASGNGVGNIPAENASQEVSTPQVYLPSGKPAGDICPSCGASSLVYEEGCSKCYSCGHSEC